MKSLLLICLLLGPSVLLAIPSPSSSLTPTLISLLLFSSSSSLSYFSYSGGQPGTSPRFVHFTRQLSINNLRFQPLYGSLQVNMYLFCSSFVSVLSSKTFHKVVEGGMYQLHSSLQSGSSTSSSPLTSVLAVYPRWGATFPQKQ